MEENSEEKSSLIISYLTLRKIMGVLGMTLPFVVSLGALIIFNTGLQSSISDYYYTGMRNVFVGTMCVIGFFLLSYRGYDDADNMVGDFGCLFAVGVALFPTTSNSAISGGLDFTGYIHLAFTALFFMTLILFSLWLFPKTDSKKQPTKRKMQRNKIYKTCGYVMSICILLIVIYALLPQRIALRFDTFAPVFWLEAMAIVAFGLSWLIKGEAILEDKV